ncbi:hypothetical protein TNCV_1158121 [Trichonephila clavipes]|nr:hypothetical protein TNCV_1158121 [Trichonephila clavipes]
MVANLVSYLKSWHSYNSTGNDHHTCNNASTLKILRDLILDIDPANFNTAKNSPIPPKNRMQPEEKGPSAVIPKPKEDRERTGDGVKTSLSTDENSSLTNHII